MRARLTFRYGLCLFLAFPGAYYLGDIAWARLHWSTGTLPACVGQWLTGLAVGTLPLWVLAAGRRWMKRGEITLDTE